LTVLAPKTECKAATLQSFVVTSPQQSTPLPTVVLQYDAASGTGWNWDTIKRLTTDDRRPDNVMRVTVEYLVEAVQRMTGQTLPVASSNDLSHGIILTTLKGAPSALQNDPEVLAALRDTGEDAYNAEEAFFLRSEKERLLVIANTWCGLTNGVAALLDSVGYEVLGMGPNWIYAPDYHNKPLSFTVKRAGRPSFYIRGFNGGSYNGTTYHFPPTDPGDERIAVSAMRWKTGWRLWGVSVPPYPGHSLDSYHDALIERIKASGRTEGFLTPQTTLGPDAARPAASKENTRALWINSDAASTPAAGKVFISNGTKWVEQRHGGLTTSLDLSTPIARELVLETMKKRAATFFEAHPDALFVFGTESEDGSYATIDEDVKHRNWYPEYLAKEKLPFGRPYALNGFRGIVQPREIWDAAAASDHVFAFNNWLLHEFDKWIDSLPESERRTATGKSKKAQTRTSLFSYNNHDVPPNFNLDGRIRVMVAGYPKHRGAGKWVQLATYGDVAAAFKVLLPREPSGEYRIISLTDYQDATLNGIAAAWSAAPTAVIDDLRSTYDAGTKALLFEMDYNFGKYGLGYYLMSKLMWDVNLTSAQLDQLRDRWLQRAYGSAWPEMKRYYDFMLPEDYPSNSPGTWGRAIALMDAADKKLSGKEPDAQRRLDDLKQFWYFYYLLDTGQAKSDSDAMKEFVWKSQMSYITASDMTIDFFPQANRNPGAAAGDYAKGPARYTHGETQQWWSKVRAHWPPPEVQQFADTTLRNKVAARTVDANDLVAVQQFRGGKPGLPTGLDRNEVTFFTRAERTGEKIGFRCFWPYVPDNRTSAQRIVDYRIEAWNSTAQRWQSVSGANARVVSQSVTRDDGTLRQSADVALAAPRAGVYRFRVGQSGTNSSIAPWDFDVANDASVSSSTMSYTSTKRRVEGAGRAWFYIPRGAKQFDVEVSQPKKCRLIFHTGLPSTGMKESRRVELTNNGAQRILLQSGEDGSLVSVEAAIGSTLFLPHPYSVPCLWARSPDALLVPRAIAIADDLTILQ
jgi:hypothetical protein